MIGVVANASDEPVIREFFELFKTPWEFWRNGRSYEVVLCTEDCRIDRSTKLVLVYAGRTTHFDSEHDVQVTTHRRDNQAVLYQGSRIPIYGETVTFLGETQGFLSDECSEHCAGYVNSSAGRVLARIGYDLFGEIRHLLTAGQPSLNANVPTLELHIAVLRNLITGCGFPLVEIPPVPEGYQFIVCLTHDVDHPSIRKHKWDHTMVGFLYRAMFGSVRKFIEGRSRLRDVAANWGAVVKLPFVYLGLTKDVWSEFDDCYLELEQDLPSTFFVIAFKDYPGANAGSRAARLRACRYEAKDILNTIHKLMAAGCEIGTHGVDAWLDSPRGRAELDEIRRLTGIAEIGVRMHWLYYDQESPLALEKAGATYDSTIGYNDTVGYRAGTTQAYKPLPVSRMLELPLHVMDTALFYPAYLHLSPKQAKTLMDRMIGNAVQFGGCLTINWHDRSIFPERLWGACYRDLIEDLKSRGAWFATAGQAVAWFRKRRAAMFEAASAESYSTSAKIVSDDSRDLPPLRLRLHKPRQSVRTQSDEGEQYIDVPFDKGIDTLSSARLTHG
jgi:hypothetical protein